MLLAFFAYHRLIFLQHANVSKHFRQTFLHAFVPLYHLCQGRLLSVVQHLVDAVSQHLSVDVIRIVEFTNTLQISQTQGSPDKPGGLSIQLCKSEKKEFYIRYSS